MIQTILFDYHRVLDTHTFNGMLKTIANSSYQSANQRDRSKYTEKIIGCYHRLGLQYAAGVISPKKFWHTLQKDGFNESTLKKAQKYILTINQNESLWSLLPSLRKKYSLMILSDCPEDKTNLIKDSVDLAHYFDAWYFSSDYGLTKKDPAFFMLPLQKYQMTPETCLFIDDSKANINFVKNIGFHTHHYTQGNAYLEKLLLKF